MYRWELNLQIITLFILYQKYRIAYKKFFFPIFFLINFQSTFLARKNSFLFFCCYFILSRKDEITAGKAFKEAHYENIFNLQKKFLSFLFLSLMKSAFNIQSWSYYRAQWNWIYDIIELFFILLISAWITLHECREFFFLSVI